MSLLLDALKRAEQEKLARLGGERVEPERTRREASMPSSSPASPASLELAPINSPSAGAPAYATTGAGERARDSAAAKNVFKAKEGADAERSKKGLILGIALAVIVILVAGAGFYVWQKVSDFTPRTAASARPRAMSPPPPQGEQTPKLDTILMPPPQQSAVLIQPPPPQQPSAAIQPPVATVAPVAPREPRDVVASLMRDAPSPTPAAPLRLAPTQERPRVSAEVAAGYQSLRSGDLASARRSYAAALTADPSNLDALLGAATIEARTGNRMLAMSHYRRALDVDPRNPTAIAGLASIADAPSDGLESQLRGEIARNPQSPQLQFTLGNLYASQARWNDAQMAFFEAYRLDPGNADVVFNLAVSLDRIGQGRLAAEHYRRALEAASHQSTQFDPAAVQRRLADLRQ